MRNRGKLPLKDPPLHFRTGKPPLNGVDIGLEIEVEGRNLPSGLTSYWTSTKDGSLRGEENMEYVLTSPIPFDKVTEAVNYLWDKFRSNETVVADSNRTSVHVHFNCSKFHTSRIASFAALYFSVEEILSHWCGDHRIGNLFCLRAKDAPAIISELKDFLCFEKGVNEISDGLHYSAFNIHAIKKFGSIEIRTLRGVEDKQILITWVGILQRLYELSAEYSDPSVIPVLFSQYGPLGYFEHLMGTNSFTVQTAWTLNHEQFKDSLYEGIRIAQELCYCVDWSNMPHLNFKADPFNRLFSIKNEHELENDSPLFSPSPDLDELADYGLDDDNEDEDDDYEPNYGDNEDEVPDHEPLS